MNSAELLTMGERRAADRFRNTGGRNAASAAQTIDEALADVAHYGEQRARAASTLRRFAVYSPSSEHSYFGDLYRSKNNATGAKERLKRHADEMLELAELEGRAVSSSGFFGLVPPAYLTDRLSAGLRAAMPLTSLIGEPLAGGTYGNEGGGMQIHIPRVTTLATGSAQNGENTTTTSTDPATTDTIANVVSINVPWTTSVQVFDRSNADLIIYRELIGALNAETEREVLAGTGATGQASGLLTSGTAAVTYTNASPTAITALPKIGATLTASSNAFLRMPPDVLVSHPRFWYWLGTAGEVVQPPLDFKTMSQGADIVGSNAMPTNLGAGTNETRLIAFPRASVYVGVAEPIITPNIEIAAVGGQLQVTVTARRYLAVATIWPTAVSILSGTGMTAVAS